MTMANRRRASPDAPGGSMGDVLDSLREEGHLSDRRYRAGMAFLAELQASHGQSAGLVGQLAEKVDTGATQRLWPSGGSRGIVALDARLNRLRRHERELMSWLVQHKERNRGSLADLGRIDSGYQTVRTGRAYAAGRIAALLDTLAEEYFGAEQPA
jgi:hypothetical protein